jgi:uncharacterized hydrophobic protein (TIGR00271 family)
MSREHKLVNRIGRRIHPLNHDERREVIDDLSAASGPGFDFYLLVILSSSIATLGLITNSPAVIIGAMLLAPIMSPIIAIGLASIIGNEHLLRKSGQVLVLGAVFSILLSFLMATVNRFLPFVSLQELPREILSRSQPTPLDLVIALSGGIAAAYAMTRKNLSAALPGVAIATALMPPLSTVGIGLAVNRMDIAGGAFLLFLTNAITIAFASMLVFFLRGFSAEVKRTGAAIPRGLVISAILVTMLLVPLSYMSVKFFKEASENRFVNTVISEEVEKVNNSQLVGVEIGRRDEGLSLVLTIRANTPILYEQVVNLQEAIATRLNRTVSLKVEQVIAEELDPLIPPTPTYTPTATHSVTPGPSLTPTPLPSATPTKTATATATPYQAQIQMTGIPGLQLYQSPGGPVIGALQKNQWVTILYGSRELDGVLWIEVMDWEGRIGWVPEIFLNYVTPTVTSTP